MIGLWNWLATRAASFYILFVALTTMGGLGVWIQQLRVDAAFCKGRQSSSVAVDKLTDRVVDNINRDLDIKRDAVEKAAEGDTCAHQSVPDGIGAGVRSR